jgi:hypothetical protein
MSKKLVTGKQNTIQTLIYAFRFLNSKQIQKFLNHKDHRRVNAWLKDLVEKEYLERDFRPIYGILTKPATYHLAAKGRSFIKTTYLNASRVYLERLSTDKKRSKGFRSRCQVLADFYLTLLSDSKADLTKDIESRLVREVTLKQNKRQFFTPAFYGDLDFLLLPMLKPDGYFYKRGENGEVHSVIFIVDAYVPRLMLSYSVKRIFLALEDEAWEYGSQALRIYFVCPSNMVVIYLRRFIQPRLEDYFGKELSFHFITRNQLYRKGQDSTKKINWLTISSEDDD